MARIIVLGGNFAGMTAALELRRKLGKEHTITVVSASKNFLFVPSLIWVPFGRRKVSDITFPAAPIFEKKGVEFIHDKAVRVVPDQNFVETEKNGNLSYDYIVITTGCGLDYSKIPGADPANGMVNCIVTPPMAEQTHEAFEKLVANPGPVVIGATQGASCMGAAYEFLFNMDHELRKHGVRDQVELTWISPEPVLGDFGIGGMTGGETMLKAFFKMYNIKSVVNSSIQNIEPDKITLDDGTVLPYKLAMLIPPFVGVEAMKNSPELVDEKGFVICNDGYQSIHYPNVFAAGLSVEVLSQAKGCKVPYGVPKTGYPSDEMGKIAAKNIVHAIKGTGKFIKKSFGDMPAICIMDAGNKEVVILGNHLFKPRQFEIMLPDITGDLGKVVLEKYMLYKNRHGMSYLP